MPNQSRVPSRSPGNRRDPPAIVDAEQSAALRDRLLAEIGYIASAELAASWAREALAAKNKLAAPDARLIAASFEGRLSELASAGTNPSCDEPAIAHLRETGTTANSGAGRSDGID